MKKIFLFLLAMCSLLNVMAQETQAPAVEMADNLRSNGKIYVVVSTLLIIFIGLAFYLLRIEKRLSKLEKEAK